ncbi:FHA domain-containing protein [Cutibacterium acnes]
MSQTFGAWRATYTPGSWVVLAGPSSLVVMQPAAPRHSDLVSSIWRHVAEARDPETLVETLSVIGLAKMPSLGVFFWVDGEMYSLARGQIVVKDASTGEVVNHGDGLLTWSEKKLNPATVVVEMERAGQGLSMPLLLGVAQASKLIIDATGNVEPFVVPQTDEVHRPRVLADDALNPWTSESDEAHKADKSEGSDETGEVPEPAVGSAAATLVSSTGEVTHLYGPVLIGRAPRGDNGEDTMRVPSLGQDISRTHVRVAPGQWGIEVTDMHSTNGTVVCRIGQEPLQLESGQMVDLSIGDSVDLGDGVVITIEAYQG